MFRAFLACFVALVLPLHAEPTTPQAIATEILAPLLDPAKVATLKGDRPANTRLYKVMYWLETARRGGGEVSVVIDQAQASAGYTGSPGAKADKLAITWSRQKLDDFGCFTDAGMAELKRGGSPTITKGDHAGDDIALDHVLPRAVVPELAARFYNLEAIPAKTKSGEVRQDRRARAVAGEAVEPGGTAFSGGAGGGGICGEVTRSRAWAGGLPVNQLFGLGVILGGWRTAKIP